MEPLHCPLCNGPIDMVRGVTTTIPILDIVREGVILLACRGCAAATEIFEDKRLVDFRGLTVMDLQECGCGLGMPRTDVTLRPCGPLFFGES